MIYLYDKAICDDLNESFRPLDGSEPAVRVIDPEGGMGIVAQIKDDVISLPIVLLKRDDYQIDESRLNFTRLHRGVSSHFDNDVNLIYQEKAIPIVLTYNMHVMTSNTADMDEILRELMFKYASMYFLNIKIPYEGQRNIRFGICIDQNSNIDRMSGPSEYINEGKLYESILHLRCEGCVMVNYTPQKLRRVEYEIDVDGDN